MLPGRQSTINASFRQRVDYWESLDAGPVAPKPLEVWIKFTKEAKGFCIGMELYRVCVRSLSVVVWISIMQSLRK